MSVGRGALLNAGIRSEKAATGPFVAFIFLCGLTAYGRASADSSSTFDLYVCKPDGSETTRITNDDRFESRPSWSPDSKRIAYSSMTPDRQSSEIRLYDFDSGNYKSYLPGDNKYDPCFSPDGELLAYAADTKSGPRICISAIDGSGQRWIDKDKDEICYEFLPAWSPDGKEIAFVARGRDDRCRVRIAEIDSLASREAPILSNDQKGHYTFPCWSPDTGELLVSRSADLVDFCLCVIDVTTGEPRVLLSCNTGEQHATASFGGQHSVILCTEDCSRIARRELPDGDPEFIIPKGVSLDHGVRYPVLSPNGKTLAFLTPMWRRLELGRWPDPRRMLLEAMKEASAAIGWAILGAKGEVLIQPKGFAPGMIQHLRIFHNAEGLEFRRVGPNADNELVLSTNRSGSVSMLSKNLTPEASAFAPKVWPIKTAAGGVYVMEPNTIVAAPAPEGTVEPGGAEHSIWVIRLANGDFYCPLESVKRPANVICLHKTKEAFNLKKAVAPYS